ncbi:unnamed protein product [Sphagnum balticum]
MTMGGEEVWSRVAEEEDSRKVVGWQMGGNNSSRGLGVFGFANSSSLSATVASMIDAGARRVVEKFIGLNMAKPSAITADLPLVRSPVPVVVAVVSYLAIVWVWSSHIKRSGLKPRVQDPKWLQCLIIAHNMFLCCLSFYLGLGILTEARRHRYSIWGNPSNDEHVKMGFYIYIFYVSKLYEFMDTAVMLLKRNLRQITYLHLYHHASICCVWWIIAHLCPTGDAYFSAAFNSWVHVAMYLYYLLAATIAKDENCRRKYLFWGKYLTMMQMIQFVAFIAQAVYGLLQPASYVKHLPRMLFYYSISLLAFFSNFFVTKYGRSSHGRQPKRLKAD